MEANYIFVIVSRKYGRFLVTVPKRFRSAIETRIWHVNRDPTRAAGRDFVVCSSKSKTNPAIYLHVFIWGLMRRKAARLDHIDGQPLNNSEMNLRPATNTQNAMNRRTRRDNSSGIPGVSWHRRIGKWSVRVGSHKERILVGYFDDLERARIARNRTVQDLHGAFAVLV